MEDRSLPPSKEHQSDESAPKKRSGTKRIVLAVVAVFVLGDAAAGVAIFWPKIRTHVPGLGASSAEPADEPAAATVVLEPIVVDIRESSGEVHHLKVGIAIELKKALHGEEFKRHEPRARDAAISFLRTLTFEEATNTTQLERIKTTLNERIALAIGKTLVKTILFTDFVAQ